MPADSAAPPFIEEGAAVCATCGRRYPISHGILSLLDERDLDPEAANEMHIRDGDTEGYDRYIESIARESAAEMTPMMRGLQPLRGGYVLELGCGTGRYTVPIIRECKRIMGVDFSLGSLRALARKLADDAPVALVQGDITRLAIAEGEFDRIVSTLVSNLPTEGHRLAMYRLASIALRTDGRFVFSTHNYGIRERWHREPIDGYYDPTYRVYRRLFRASEVEAEAKPYFDEVACRRIAVVPPFAQKLKLPIVSFSALAESIPLVNDLARILMFVAARPRMNDRAA